MKKSNDEINLNFFGDIDTLKEIHNLVSKNSSDDDVIFDFDQENLAISFDLIKAPWHITIHSSKENITLNFYVRDSYASYSNVDFSIKVYSDGRAPKIDYGQSFVFVSSSFFAKTATYLFSFINYISKNKLLEKYKDLDIEKEGVLVYLEYDSVREKLLCGDERPSLMSTYLSFGKQVNEKIRPYKYDIPTNTIFSSVRSSSSSSKKSLDKSKKSDAEKEENQKKELEYERAYEQWEKDCAQASIKRSHEEQIFINSEKDRLLSEHQKKIDENNALIAQYTDKINALEDEMYELGFFNFSEKAEKRNSISTFENKIAEINHELNSLRDSFNQTMANIDSDEDILLKAKRAAKKKVPFPQEPWFDSPECRFKRKLSIIIEEIFAQYPGLNDANFLYEYIEEHVDEPFSKNDLYRILMKMCKNGILCSITIKNKTYYAKLDEDF